MSQERELVTTIWRLQRGLNMHGARFRNMIKSVVAVLCAACFLAMSLGSVSHAVAADNWETWPKPSPLPPGLTPKPETNALDSGKTGDAAGKETEEKTSSKKLWWLAAGAAVVIGIAIAAGSSGGGGGGGGTTTNPGHY
jgi:hypothetical protein